MYSSALLKTLPYPNNKPTVLSKQIITTFCRINHLSDISHNVSAHSLQTACDPSQKPDFLKFIHPSAFTNIISFSLPIASHVKEMAVRLKQAVIFFLHIL